jgi:hypothetical protein
MAFKAGAVFADEDHTREKKMPYAPLCTHLGLFALKPMGLNIKNQRSREFRPHWSQGVFKLAGLVDRPLKFIPAKSEGETKWTTKDHT